MGITRRHAHTYLGKKLKVKMVVPHPGYKTEANHDNDIALFKVIKFSVYKLNSHRRMSTMNFDQKICLTLQLENRVEFHEHLRPVCLPKPNKHISAGTMCTVIGWGKKEDTDSKFIFYFLYLYIYI